MSAAAGLWRAIGRQLENPSGIGGHIAGQVMRAANGGANAAAVAALEIGPGDEVLEIGFGPGQAIARMAALAPSATVHGIDRSAVMLRQARSRNAAAIRAGRVELRLADFEALPFAGESFDKILAVNVVYFWTDPLRVMGEAARVMRANGLLAVYATEESAMRRWKFAGPETHRLYDAQTLVALAREAGFAPAAIAVRSVRAAPGVPGFVATMRKGARA